jgi:hypothetical protein
MFEQVLPNGFMISGVETIAMASRYLPGIAAVLPG